MKNNRIKWLLFFTILIMTVLPMTAAVYFLDHTLQTSLNLGFNPQIVRALDIGSYSLKNLKTLDPQNQEVYRKDFEELENLKYVYLNPELVKGSILDSLKIYFGIGLVASVLLSLFLALILSRRIAHIYQSTFQDLEKQKDKVRYLEEISSWQELAKILAHEIKNPLTPIEILMGSLSKSYAVKAAAAFKAHLIETETIVIEELGHLKAIVNKFSEFSRVPQVQPSNENVAKVVQHQLQQIAPTYERATLEFMCEAPAQASRASIDSPLFRQVFANLIKNGVEANPDTHVRFQIRLKDQNGNVKIEVWNDGRAVPPEMVGRMFDPYVSSKKGKENMGLGLAVVKKIVTEHGGEISYVESEGKPMFVITLKKIIE